MSSSNTQGQGSSSGPTKPPLRKPVFTNVDSLKPGTYGLTLVVKVVSCEAVSLRSARIAECLVGDETGAILFTARNDQGTMLAGFCVFFCRFVVVEVLWLGNARFLVDLMKPGASVIIRNGKIDMFKGSMRLAVDKWGRIEVTDPVAFEVNEDNNLSLVEYELVNVSELSN
ncbi:nucleic acid-binding, OB-fold protein [Tanacetum coccineum]